MALKLSQNEKLYRKYVEQMSYAYNTRVDIRMFVEVFLSLITIIIFLVFAIRPTLKTISLLYKEINSKRGTLQKLEDKVQALTQAQQVYESQRVSISILNLAVPNEALSEKYLRQIEGMAKLSGTTVSNMSTKEIPIFGGPGSQGESPDSFTFSFDVLGSYDAVALFLSDFENSRRPMKIISAQLSAPKDETETNLRLSITGDVSYKYEERN